MGDLALELEDEPLGGGDLEPCLELRDRLELDLCSLLPFDDEDDDEEEDLLLLLEWSEEEDE